MFPRNENRNEGTFACSPRTATGTRVHLPKPPFYETARLATPGLLPNPLFLKSVKRRFSKCRFSAELEKLEKIFTMGGNVEK